MRLEDRIRTTLERRLSDPPATPGAWDRIEAGIRRRVRRRTALTGAAVSVAIVAGAVAVPRILDWSQDVRPATPLGGLALASTISLEDQPSAVAVDHRTNRVYVASRAGRSVAVIDGATDRVIATIDFPAPRTELPLESQFREIVAMHANNAVYVVGFDDIYRIDGADNTVRALNLDIGGRVDLAVDQELGILYFTWGNDVLAMESDGTVRWRVDSGTSMWGLAVDEVLHRVYVLGNGAAPLLAFDGATGRKVSTSERDYFGAPWPMAVDAASHRIYLGDEPGRIHVIDGSTLELIDTIEDIYAIGLDTRLGRLLVSSDTRDGFPEGVLSVFEFGRRRPIGRLSLPSRAERIGDAGVVTGSGLPALASNSMTGRIYLVSPGTNQVFVVTT